MHSKPELEGFWEFSLRTYGRPGVAAVCLALQDELGADINLVLYCCWAGGRAGPLDEGSFGHALAFSREWSARVVQPLRGARRWMKAEGCAAAAVDTESCLALRERIKAVELSAENLQQMALEARPLPGPEGAGLAAVAANLGRYFEAIGASLDTAATERLSAIVEAAFPQASGGELQAFAAALAGN